MIYVFVDTNIWIRILTQAIPGCELEHLDKLQELITSRKVVLLMPEIVELEVEKNRRELTDNLTRSIATLQTDIEQAMKKKTWNEIEDVKKQVTGLLQDAKERKMASAERSYLRVAEVFKSPHVVRLPFTPADMLSGRKRLIAGRMPNCSKQATNDAYIIESLLSYFKDVADGSELYFCTENNDDFALETDEGLVLHPLVATGMPKAKCVNTLRDMMEFYDSHAKIDEPPPEVIERALEGSVVRAEGPPHTTKCAIEGCRRYVWWIGPYCERHFDRYFSELSTEEQAALKSAVLKVLKTLSYREREIFKLRAGWADGFKYTREEVGHIFKMTRRNLLKAERIILRKLMQPTRRDSIAPYFEKQGPAVAGDDVAVDG